MGFPLLGRKQMLPCQQFITVTNSLGLETNSLLCVTFFFSALLLQATLKYSVPCYVLLLISHPSSLFQFLSLIFPQLGTDTDLRANIFAWQKNLAVPIAFLM